MLVYSHSDCKLKNNGLDHPERKERLETIIESIKQIKDFRINFKEAPIADMETISLVHPRKHIEKIFANIPKSGLIGVEKEPYADTMLCPNSKSAILRSCGAGLAAVDDLMKNNEREIGRNALHSFVATFLLVILGLMAALAAGLIIDKNFFTLLLSYCPGGIYEVAVIAIFFDLDPEFVSFHHIIRLLMILFIVPIMLKIISKKA